MFKNNIFKIIWDFIVIYGIVVVIYHSKIGVFYIINKKITLLLLGTLASVMLATSTPVFAATQLAEPDASMESQQISAPMSIAMYGAIHTPLGDAVFLKQGSRGEWVKSLQANLNSCVHTDLDVDGIYGPATATAVRDFQKYVKVKYNCSTISVDGQAGYQTWTALYALMDGMNPHQFIN